MSAAAHDGAVPVGGSRLRRHLPVLERLESPVTTYYLLLGATLCLLVIGLVMVLSASSVTSLTKTGSSFTTFKSQAVFAALGVPLMLVASRLSLRTWQRLGWGMVVATVVAQALVFSPLGVEVNGNRNWIEPGRAAAAAVRGPEGSRWWSGAPRCCAASARCSTARRTSSCRCCSRWARSRSGWCCSGTTWAPR
ncbi:hypothetical protein GCM10025868_06690 [Angustibacter aerolatus]|uniref:Probable peptidoglycan glycosyltransferase FtsW n=1 Tax=Angustibacter aerolatus TaxID=1162965 RepID=A0ABQ6JDA5_9ACTN|nr:FtsW/RodA/SpoVE family cell cycle protein [Angustibacter aerolatus]GMA85419.1 hypothetical protein GCM10025868_06690 [Angustibacter aerolatus]